LVPVSPKGLIWLRALGTIGFSAGLAVGGFQLGRQSVSAVTVNHRAAKTLPDVLNPSRHREVQIKDHQAESIREVAAMPFSEIYDVLRSATRTQKIAWAAELERMPRGPRQNAAIAAYFKSLVQVDSKAAIQAV